MKSTNDSGFIYKNYEILKVITGEDFKENCYIVLNHEDQEQFIIDPGYDHEDIINCIEKNREYKICNILATHAHHDHIGGAFELCDYYGVPCIIHPNDRKLLHRLPLYSMSLAKRNVKIPRKIAWLDVSVEQDLSKKGIRIIPTPGHSGGSCCILYKDCIFTGDTIFRQKVGRTDLPESNKEQLISSINYLFEKYNDFDLFPGHGEMWNLENARKWWNSSENNAK